jgi:hypothetical protein
MSPEKVLFYSLNCYGTADAISWYDGVLRIHDLKTGVTPGSMNQLLIYAALFCLDYGEEPKEIHLRLYQNEEVIQMEPEYRDIFDIMTKIIEYDKLIQKVDEGVIF